MHQIVLISFLLPSLLSMCASFEIKCSKFLETVNYCHRLSSSDISSSQVPTYRDDPKPQTSVAKENQLQYSSDIYVESTDETIDPALRQEIESALKLTNPLDLSSPTNGANDPLLMNQEGRLLGKNKIVNFLHDFFVWEENQKRKTSKVARVAGKIAGDIASMVIAERFRKVGMAAGDLARLYVSDLTIKGLDGFRGILGIKI